MLNEAAPQITIPFEARQAFATFTGPSTSTLTNAGVLPTLVNTVDILEQIPKLIDEVSIFMFPSMLILSFCFLANLLAL